MKNVLARLAFDYKITAINGTINAPALATELDQLGYFTPGQTTREKAYAVSGWLQAAAKQGLIVKHKGDRAIAPTGGNAWNVYHRAYKSRKVAQLVRNNVFTVKATK